MPSLDVLAKTEELLGKPVISAATATVYQAMKTLGMPLNMNTYGKLLSGKLEI
jgi:maleate isomerase